MSASVWLGKTRVKLADANLLGVGGEGSVYAHRDRAVKVYHPAPPGDFLAARKLALTIAKVEAFPRALPDAVVAPLELARDDAGAPVGYAMRRVQGATEVSRLATRAFCEGRIPAAQVLALFGRIHGVLTQLHARGVVLGDFNDANVLFEGSAPFFIDADSAQFGSFPCVVAHERFLDPRLYGTSLAPTPAFSETTDWYAFTVMLFVSLLYTHPYGGIHKTLPTLLRRAEARHSVLRPDVSYPKAAVHFHVLPDELLHWAEDVFDRDARESFPPHLLSMRWSRCSCGLEHARKACPECAAPRPTASAVRTSGSCRATTVFTTRGRILAAAMQGGLKYVVEESDAITREDGACVFHPAGDAARVAIQGAATWIGRGARVARVRNGSVEATASTCAFRNEPMFDASASHCFGIDGGFIVDVDRGTRIGQVLEGQTWFRVGDELGFGFYQTGSITEYFLFRTARGGLTRVELPPIRGKLVDCAACFAGDRVLFSMATDHLGRRTHAIYLVEGDGRVIASGAGAPDDQPMLASLQGKCLAHGSILCATDEGLLLVRPGGPGDRELVPAKLFVDTHAFVSEGSELLVGPGGSVYVVGQKEITQLSLM